MLEVIAVVLFAKQTIKQMHKIKEILLFQMLYYTRNLLAFLNLNTRTRFLRCTFFNLRRGIEFIYRIQFIFTIKKEVGSTLDAWR